MLYEGYQILHFKVLDIIGNLADESFQTKLLSALLRGITRIIGAAWSYLLMLIAMTFNVGLFFAVILGLGCGSATFGPYLSKLQERKLVSHQTEDLCC